MELTSNRCFPNPQKRGRPPKDRRRIIDAILDLVKCGCPWRYLPADFPHWKTGYHVFRQWANNHAQWAVLNDTLRILVRKTHAKRSRPTAAILDSQSIKSAGHGGDVGYDIPASGSRGRKRHLLVDTLGLVLGVVVTPASTTERDGAHCFGPGPDWFHLVAHPAGRWRVSPVKAFASMGQEAPPETGRRSRQTSRTTSLASSIAHTVGSVGTHLRLVDASAATRARLRNHEIRAPRLGLYRRMVRIQLRQI